MDMGIPINSSRRTARNVFAFLASLLMLFAASSVFAVNLPKASAHDAVIQSDPADGAQLEEFPSEFTLTFSGEPRDSYNTVAVSDTDSNEVLFTTEPEINGNLVTFSTPSDVNPGAGSYLIGFQITSSDGHATRGGVSFSVLGDGATSNEAEQNQDSQNSTETTAQQADDVETPAERTFASWVWFVIAGVVIAVIAVIVGARIANRKG